MRTALLLVGLVFATLVSGCYDSGYYAGPAYPRTYYRPAYYGGGYGYGYGYGDQSPAYARPVYVRPVAPAPVYVAPRPFYGGGRGFAVRVR